MANILRIEVDLDRMTSGYDGEYVGDMIKETVDAELKKAISAQIKKELTVHKSAIERAVKKDVATKLKNIEGLIKAMTE